MELEKHSYHLLLFKAIDSLFVKGSANILNKGIKVIIGNGARVSFWEDIRCDDTSLRVAFLRVFDVASMKECYITDFERWVNNNWVFEVPLKRPLFDWGVKPIEMFPHLPWLFESYK